jgi:hypothetical protein
VYQKIFFTGNGSESISRDFHFFSGNRVQGADYRNSLNEGFDGTGPGIRVRYAQLRNCIDVSPFIN